MAIRKVKGKSYKQVVSENYDFSPATMSSLRSLSESFLIQHITDLVESIHSLDDRLNRFIKYNLEK